MEPGILLHLASVDEVDTDTRTVSILPRRRPGREGIVEEELEYGLLTVSFDDVVKGAWRLVHTVA